jgi:hypothetical protein
MYIQLLVTAIAVQRDLANAYTASNRDPEVGAYFLTLVERSLEFFRQIAPSNELKVLHDKYLSWQESAVEALREEISVGEGNESRTGPAFLAESQRFAEEFSSLIAETEAEHASS